MASKRFGLVLSLFLGGSLLLWGCGKGKGTPAKPGVLHLKLAHVLPRDHPVHIALVKAAELLKKKSKGRIELEVIPDGRYGTERQALEKLKMGILPFTKVSMAALEQFQPKAAVFSYPFLFRDDAHRWKVMNGPIGKELLDCAAAQGFKGICYMDAGWRSFYTKEGHPIRTIADLQGLKIRCINAPTMVKAIKALGANTTNIEWGELYSALQQGIVDGAENNIPSLYSSRQYEVVKYYTLDRHMAVPDVVVASTQVWKKLSEPDRNLILQCFQEASREERRLWKERCAKDLGIMKKAGLQVIELTPRARQGFIEKARSFYEELDPAMKALADRIRGIR